MADYTVTGAAGAHFSAAAGELVRVTFPEDVATVELVNRDGAAEVWWRLGGTDAAPESQDCWVVPAVVCVATREPRTSGPTVVVLRASAAARLSVQRGAS